MSRSRPAPTEEEWEGHKAAIRRLYLVEEQPQKALLEAVNGLGLNVTYAPQLITYSPRATYLVLTSPQKSTVRISTETVEVQAQYRRGGLATGQP